MQKAHSAGRAPGPGSDDMVVDVAVAGIRQGGRKALGEVGGGGASVGYSTPSRLRSVSLDISRRLRRLLGVGAPAPSTFSRMARARSGRPRSFRLEAVSGWSGPSTYSGILYARSQESDPDRDRSRVQIVNDQQATPVGGAQPVDHCCKHSLLLAELALLKLGLAPGQGREITAQDSSGLAPSAGVTPSG